MAKLIGIAVRPFEDAPMLVLEETLLDVKAGVDGDYGGGGKGRQATILSLADWQAACAEVDVALDWTTRRANFLVENIGSLQSAKGKRVQIGDAVLEITGETMPCNLMEEAQSGLRGALSSGWRGGVTCRILQSGRVRNGDAVAISEPETA